MDSIRGGPQSGVVAQKVIAGNDIITSSYHGCESAGTSRTVAALGRVRVPQENRIVKIEKKSPRRAPQQC
jgi:hypothetical protein